MDVDRSCAFKDRCSEEDEFASAFNYAHESQVLHVCAKDLELGNYTVSLRACTKGGKRCGNSFDHLFAVKPAWSSIKRAEGPSSIKGWVMKEED